MMNLLIGNCRGEGGLNFHNLIRDCIRIYKLDFVAMLAPRISGFVAESVINRIGLDDGARVDAIGFSGGIWCLWKANCPPIRVVSTSRYCIHLLVNADSPSAWYLSVIYASFIASNREVM